MCFVTRKVLQFGSVKVALCTTEEKMVCEKLKIKITVYFATCVHRSILNNFSTKL